jgi:hypothetical protein
MHKVSPSGAFLAALLIVPPEFFRTVNETHVYLWDGVMTSVFFGFPKIILIYSLNNEVYDY